MVCCTLYTVTDLADRPENLTAPVHRTTQEEEGATGYGGSAASADTDRQLGGGYGSTGRDPAGSDARRARRGLEGAWVGLWRGTGGEWRQRSSGRQEGDEDMGGGGSRMGSGTWW